MSAAGLEEEGDAANLPTSPSHRKRDTLLVVTRPTEGVRWKGVPTVKSPNSHF